MNYNFITIGSDCSTASALKNLNLRIQSLPFDWVVSDINKVIECIDEEFINFHKNLYLNNNKTRVIDFYRFEYPHDYPNSEVFDADKIGDGVFEEKTINSDWEDFIDSNIEKYNRRIKRFMNILNDEKDLVVLYRGSISNIMKFKNFLEKKYNKYNVKYLVATFENYSSDNIISCNPEMNGEWNDSNIWKDGLKKLNINL